MVFSAAVDNFELSLVASTASRGCRLDLCCAILNLVVQYFVQHGQSACSSASLERGFTPQLSTRQKTVLKYNWFYTYFVVQVGVAAMLPLDWHVRWYEEDMVCVTPVLFISHYTDEGINDLKS